MTQPIREWPPVLILRPSTCAKRGWTVATEGGVELMVHHDPAALRTSMRMRGYSKEDVDGIASVELHVMRSERWQRNTLPRSRTAITTFDASQPRTALERHLAPRRTTR